MILFIPHNKPMRQGLCLHSSHKKTKVQSSLRSYMRPWSLQMVCAGSETRVASLYINARVTYVYSSVGLSGPVNFLPI